MPSGRRGKGRKIGLALASGGFLGGVYEVGALRALEESVQGLDLNRLDIYVGVSAGAFVGAHLANGVRVGELLRGVRAEPGDDTPFDSSILFRPALGELPRWGLQLPGALGDVLLKFLDGHEHSALLESLASLGPSLPVGLFDSEPIREYLHRAFTLPGRTDDFRRLPRKLMVVATDLETGEGVVFGRGGLDRVPISRAVQASAAVPGLYRPVEVDGRVCVDGVLLKTVHSSVALEQGAGLLLCVNPLVPINTGSDLARESLGLRAVQRGGLPAILSQSFRILIHSRVVLGMARSIQTHPDADLLLFEPKPTEHRMFTNLFRVHSRDKVCEIGYEQTRADLWRRRDLLGPVFARHGLRLRTDLLADPSRSVWDGLAPRKAPGAGLAGRLEAALDALETDYPA